MLLDRIVSEIINIRWLIITFIVVGVILFLIMWFGLSEFGFSKGKIKLFSMLYGFKAKDCIYVALIVCRFIYIVFFSIYNKDFTVEYLIPLLIMTLLINLLLKDYFNMITGTFSSIAVYVIIYLQASLRTFYLEVESDPLILIMIILLIVFTILFAVYSLISAYNHLLTIDRKDSENYESLQDTNKITWPKTKQSGKLKSSS